jgi:hypothetical protein
VIDEAGNYSQIRYQIHVLGPKLEKELQTKKKDTKTKEPKTKIGT